MTIEPASLQPPRTSGGVLATLRAPLETAALLMIVLVSGAMLLTILRGSRSVAAAAPARSARTKPAPPPLPTDPISIEGAQLQGSRNAKVAMVEYSDFQCPFCGRFARETLPALERTYVQSGKVLFAFRQFPLASIHPFAMKAAEATECAGEQGQFWKMHDLTFADQTHLDDAALHDRAKAVGLNSSQFDHCLQQGVADKIQADEKTGTSLIVGGTPTFFVGQIQPDGRVKVTNRLSGALPAANFSAVLDPLLGVAAVAVK